jgi:hypothetical protein
MAEEIAKVMVRFSCDDGRWHHFSAFLCPKALSIFFMLST